MGYRVRTSDAAMSFNVQRSAWSQPAGLDVFAKCHMEKWKGGFGCMC